MEFFYVVKATQKSGKEDAVIWFTAKSVARANLQLDVELEDAGIETGRGKDYVKPVRTDFPVYNDLPEESTVDYTWCKRYELQDDGRTWLPKAGAESTGAMDNTAAPETSVKVETTVESVPLENRTPAVRFAVHLTSDKYLSHITKEQQLAASGMSLDESNTYLQNLLLAKNNIPEVAELSLNAEWKLVQAIKQVFAPDETHEAEVIAAFMADWARADAGNRNQLVEEWRSGKLNLLKSEITSETGVTTDQDPEPDNGIQIDENDDETTRYPVVRMPFRKQLLAQFTTDELRHHLTREEYEDICALEMDTDNSYVQNLLLAAENCEEVRGYDTKDLWRYTDAIRKVFSQEKRHELALVLRFTRIWAATDYIDRGILAREWAIHYEPTLGARGEMIGAVAYARMKTGEFQFEWLNLDDIAKVRAASKNSDKGPWVDWYESMARKSAAHRLCRRLPNNSEIMEMLERGTEMVWQKEKDITPPAAGAPLIEQADRGYSDQEGSFDAEIIAEEFRQQISSAEVANEAKEIGSRIDALKNELGANLHTELKNKALGRFHQINANNKIADLINGLPKPGSEEAKSAFADVEKKLEFLKPRLGDELYQGYLTNLADMKPEYVN